MKKKNDWIKKGILIIVLLVCITAYLWVPGIHKTMSRIFKMFASGDFTVVRDFVASYGGYAVLISFLLMIFQSIAAPLPAFLITFANASLFGWWKGAILSWSSAMAGAAVCFYIAKILFETFDRGFYLRGDYYGGLHCGECMDVFTGGKWKPTRIEMSAAQEWYLVGIRAEDLNGLRVRI